MSIELKIKCHTLTDEARHIKRWERKLKRNRRKAVKKMDLTGEDKTRAQSGDSRREKELRLREHRIEVVRPAARICHLAKGFLRGTPYAKIEGRCEHRPNFDKIEKEARRFSSPADWGGPDNELKTSWKSWLLEAKHHLDPQQKAKWAAEKARDKALAEQRYQEALNSHRRRELAQLRSLALSHPDALAALASGDKEAMEAAGVPSAFETKSLARRTRPVRTVRVREAV